MTKAEEQQIIIKWVYDMKKALEPKKRGPKSDMEVYDKNESEKESEKSKAYVVSEAAQKVIYGRLYGIDIIN